MRVSQLLPIAVFGLLRGTVAAPPFLDSNYQWSPQTSISFVGSTEFSRATERWDLYKAPTYTVAISPGNEADVVKAVTAAQKLGLPFLATGGRHGYTGTLAKMKGGVAIDLSKLNSVSINKKDATMTIGAGVRFGDIFDPLYNAGFQIQTGTATCPGMVGVTMGGGIGRLGGLQGLVLDALVSARIVIANGTVLEVSEKKNSDLFWAVRGAGHNFGIITSATYKVQPLYKNGVWTSVDLILPLEKNVSYFQTVSKMMPLPADLTVQTTIVYDSTAQKPSILASLVYAGPQAEGLKAMAPILNLGPFPFQNTSTLAWNQLATGAQFQINAGICAKSQIFNPYGFALKTFDAPTFSTTLQKMANFYQANPSARASTILIESWPNQAVKAVPDANTAYPWRDAATYGLILLRWDTLGDPVEGPANALGSELRADLGRTSGYGKLVTYVNYARGDEGLEAIYGASKLPRLAQLKAKYDPKKAFGFYNPLPTSYP